MTSLAPLSLGRRDLLKGAGALVVSFSLWSPLSRALAQSGDGRGNRGADP